MGRFYKTQIQSASAVDAGHEDLVDILIRGTAFEAGIVPTSREIVGPNGLILAVGQRRRRRTVSIVCRGPVPEPALRALEAKPTGKTAPRSDDPQVQKQPPSNIHLLNVEYNVKKLDMIIAGITKAHCNGK